MFEIGCTENPQIRVSVQSYERTPTGDLYDDNWVTSTVDLRINGFSACYKASFLTQDFIIFESQLKQLFESLSGVALFDTLERQLSIKMSGNGLAGIEVTGTACDTISGENELTFSFDLDQTHLSHTIRGLNELISEFPSRPA